MIATLPLILFPFCLIAAALSDARRYIIPNEISVILVVGFGITALIAGMGLADLGNHVLTALVVLAFGFGLFCINVFGAGDGKLLAASALWFGMPSFFAALMAITLVGGALCLGLLLGRRFARTFPILSLYIKPLATLAATDELKCPYGIAIAIGSIWVFKDSPLVETLLANALF